MPNTIGKDPKRAADVWLLSDVTADKMSMAQAGSFYRMRWENEGLFRSYKRTLSKIHLVGRTVRSVHRDAYGSLLACQLLLAQGAWALQETRHRTGVVVPCRPRELILEVRQEVRSTMRPRRRGSYRDRLERGGREPRDRRVGKQKRVWPQRTPHKPPILLTRDKEQKALAKRFKAVT